MHRPKAAPLRAGLILIIPALIAVGALIIINQPRPDPFQGQAVVNPAFPSLTYGIQTFLWWDTGYAGMHMDWVRLMSYSHIKQTFSWRNMEPEEDIWNYREGDRIVDEAQRRSLKIIARLGQTPDWAAPTPISISDDLHDIPPVNLQDWADYCREVAERYKGRIQAYQIWNEPNLQREWGGQPPNAEDYVELLAACSTEIRQADPEAIIISAGIAPTGNYDNNAHRDDIYLDAMYHAGFQQYVDVVGVHAPGFAAPSYGPDDAERDGQGRWATFRRIEDLRKIMIQHDDAARQMAILEFGWTTDPVNPDYAWYAVDEQTQAEYLVAAYEYAIEHWRPWVGLMSLIYMPKTVWTEADEEYWWAITTPDKGHREAFFQLANMRKVCDDFIIPAREPDSPEALGLVPTTICP